MVTKQLLVVSALVLVVAFHSGEGLASESEEVLETISGKGSVNWSSGTIAAKGQGATPEKYYGTPQARTLALKAARIDAYRNLFEVAKGVRIESGSRAGEAMCEDDSIEAQMRELVKSAEIVKREYHSDGTVEVMLAMSLYGGFAQLVLPKDVKQLPEIKTIVPVPATPGEGDDAQESQDLLQSDPGSATGESGTHTGLVLDGRGLHGSAALSPKIFDEKGEEVYGSAFVSREFAVQNGMAGYVQDLEAGKARPRVSDRPFTVKGLRTTVPGGSDFVISNSDAAKIRSSSENLSFLRKCRVVIVLD